MTVINEVIISVKECGTIFDVKIYPENHLRLIGKESYQRQAQAWENPG